MVPSRQAFFAQFELARDSDLVAQMQVIARILLPFFAVQFLCVDHCHCWLHFGNCVNAAGPAALSVVYDLAHCLSHRVALCRRPVYWRSGLC